MPNYTTLTSRLDAPTRRALLALKGDELVQSGSESATADGSGDVAVTFPTPYKSTPDVVAVRFGTSAAERTCHVTARGPSGFTVRNFNSGTAAASTSVSFMWIARGR